MSSTIKKPFEFISFVFIKQNSMLIAAFDCCIK